MKTHSFRFMVVRLAVVAALFATITQVMCHDDEDNDRRTSATAFAVPLEGINIDGKLDDWPKNMVRYRFLNNYAPYGETELQKKGILNNEDFAASFMVGYSVKEQLLYVAIVVTDKDNVPSNPNKNGNPAECDATEIFLDGLHAQRHTPWMEFEYPATLAAMQYVATPGPDLAYFKGRDFNPAGDNPVLNGANIKKTKSKCVWSREGNITTYEWAVQVYDHFPTQTQIEPGKRIGFDVIVANLDRPDGKTNYHAAWLPFGAPAPWKMFDASSLADLVFLAKDVPLVPVQGSVTDPTGEGLNANLRVSIFQIFAPVGGGYIRKVPMGEEQTNAAGQFTISLPPGKYVAEPAKNEILRHAKTEFTVEQDKQCHVYLAVAPLNSVSVLGKDVMPLVVPFIEAIKNNKTKDALEILHAHHPIAKARDYHNGASALSIAAEKENLQLMEALIKAGADVNAADEQNTTALHEAAENGNGVIVQVLLKNGANPEIVETDYGCTPLLWAVYGYEHNQPVQDQLEIVKALVHAGANPNAKNNEGKNALNMASKDDPMRKLLIDLGVKD